jgi:hypothetical protein
MKCAVFFILFFGLNSISQLNYFTEYNISNIFLSDNNIILDNNLSFGLKKNKSLLSIGIGREDWYLDYFNNKYFTNPSIYNAHCRTYKSSILFERQFFLIKSKLSVNLGLGGKIYFLNQLKDSLSTSNNGFLDITKPSFLTEYASKTPYSYTVSNDYEEYRLISSMPYAFTTNLAFQYTFKSWALKLFFQANLIKIKYNFLYPFTEDRTDKGSNYTFYSSVGLGINYPLNFKKKEKTSPPNQ